MYLPLVIDNKRCLHLLPLIDAYATVGLEKDVGIYHLNLNVFVWKRKEVTKCDYIVYYKPVQIFAWHDGVILT